MKTKKRRIMDKVRLDWIQENHICLAFDIVSFRWLTLKNGLWSKKSKSARDAIDAAIRADRERRK